MKYRAIALDLDGTLTNSKKQVTERTRQAVKAAKENGAAVILASGRPTCGILPVAEELGIDGIYILSFNGAVISEYPSGKVVHNQSLSIDTVKRAAELAEKHNMNILSYDGNCIFTETPDDIYAVKEATLNRIGTIAVPSFTEHAEKLGTLTKCLCLGDGEHLAEVEPLVRESLKDSCSVYRSEPFFLEIMPLNVDKAASLEILLNSLNIKREELIACGDGFNDLSMIEYAGLGVAMANAQNIVKEKSDVLTSSNDDDGVAEVIDKYILQI